MVTTDAPSNKGPYYNNYTTDTYSKQGSIVTIDAPSNKGL